MEGEITESTLNWRIHSLLKRRLIKRQGRGVFALGETSQFVPEIDISVKKMHTQLNKQFPYAKICLWNTKIFNQWMLHQPSHFSTVVEVEKDAVESVFQFLQEHYDNVFLQPDKELMERYAIARPNVIIVLSLVSEAPTEQIHGTYTVTLEKLIVDVFCKPQIFAAQQGRDLAFIYDNIFAKYTINKNKLLRYADRRKKKEALLNYLITKTKFRHFYGKSAIS
jgi:uncharacterized protein DUF6577